MAKNNARIGKDDERLIVKDLEALGYRARRQPGSGNRAVDLQHDVVWQDSPAGKLHIEGKYRESCQWKVLEKWRAGADILTLRCDGRKGGQDGQRMAYLPWEVLLRLVGEAAVSGLVDSPEDAFRANLTERLVKPKAKIPQRANPWPKRGERPFRKGAR